MVAASQSWWKRRERAATRTKTVWHKWQLQDGGQCGMTDVAVLGHGSVEFAAEIDRSLFKDAAHCVISPFTTKKTMNGMSANT